MKTPLISIIVPCYNQAKYLDEALHSVFIQSYKNWECIIVNDGSFDDTESVAAQWTKKDKRYVYLYQENSGLSSARNAGLRKACGDYIQFLDSDDVIEASKFEKQIEDLITHDISISDYFSFVDGTKDKAPFRYLSPKFSQTGYKKEIIWDWEYRKSFPPHCPLFKKRLIDQYNLSFNESLANHEDWEFWVKLFYYSKNIHCNSLTLSYYRIREGSMSSEFKSMNKGFLKAAVVLQKFFKVQNNKELYKLAKDKHIEIKSKNKVPLKAKLKSQLNFLKPIYLKYVKKH